MREGGESDAPSWKESPLEIILTGILSLYLGYILCRLMKGLIHHPSIHYRVSPSFFIRASG